MAGWQPKLFQAYQLINQGHSKDPATWIKKLFRSKYIVLSARVQNMALAQQLLIDPRVKEVYSDPRVKIFHLNIP